MPGKLATNFTKFHQLMANNEGFCVTQFKVENLVLYNRAYAVTFVIKSSLYELAAVVVCRIDYYFPGTSARFQRNLGMNRSLIKRIYTVNTGVFHSIICNGNFILVFFFSFHKMFSSFKIPYFFQIIFSS